MKGTSYLIDGKYYLCQENGEEDGDGLLIAKAKDDEGNIKTIGWSIDHDTDNYGEKTIIDWESPILI